MKSPATNTEISPSPLSVRRFQPRPQLHHPLCPLPVLSPVTLPAPPDPPAPTPPGPFHDREKVLADHERMRAANPAFRASLVRERGAARRSCRVGLAFRRQTRHKDSIHLR